MRVSFYYSLAISILANYARATYPRFYPFLIPRLPAPGGLKRINISYLSLKFPLTLIQPFSTLPVSNRQTDENFKYDIFISTVYIFICI